MRGAGGVLFSLGMIMLFASPAPLFLFRFAWTAYSWVFWDYLGLTAVLLVVGFLVARSARPKAR